MVKRTERQKEWEKNVRPFNAVRFFDRTSPISIIFFIALAVLIVVSVFNIFPSLGVAAMIVLAAFILYFIIWLILKLS
ncbi:MAG: hypothetical protein WCK90_04605 [archaeon]